LKKKNSAAGQSLAQGTLTQAPRSHVQLTRVLAPWVQVGQTSSFKLLGRRPHSSGRRAASGQVEVECSVFFLARFLLQEWHMKFLTCIVTCPGLHSGKGTNPRGRNRKSLTAASKILQRQITETPQSVYTK